MPGFPKIALARLKANPNSSGAASGPAAFQGTEHPDANLLAAFVEKSLTEKERTQVLNHLAACAGCREVAALTLPGGDEAAEPVRAAGRQSWSPWPVLRWGAMAVVLGTVALIVALRPEVWRRRPSGSNEARPSGPTQTFITARQTPPPSPNAQPGSEAAPMKERKEARTSAADGVSPVKAAAPSSNVALNDHAIRREAKRQVAVMASAQPPATTNVENPSAVKAERQEERSGNALGAAAIPAPPQPSAPAALSAPTSELGAMAKETGEPQAGPAAPRATTQSVAVTGGMSSGQAESVPAKTDSSRTSLSGLHVEPAAPTLAMRASHKGVKVAAGSPNTLWSVSSTGIVHRSTDGGRTLEEVHVAPGISFHAIASRGNNVWAGGTGGALFHSTDGGATWARVAVNPGGNTITEAIISIQMRDALRLTVTFATGVQWTTEDGGQQWQMKP